jgi:hypothetical protein
MNKYDSIQPILEDWAHAHGLLILTNYQGEEIRATEIVDDKGAIYGLWVSVPDSRGHLTIGAAAHRKRGPLLKKECSVPDLRTELERCYHEIDAWIRESGSTRTPVK